MWYRVPVEPTHLSGSVVNERQQGAGWPFGTSVRFVASRLAEGGSSLFRDVRLTRELAIQEDSFAPDEQTLPVLARALAIPTLASAATCDGRSYPTGDSAAPGTLRLLEPC